MHMKIELYFYRNLDQGSTEFLLFICRNAINLGISYLIGFGLGNYFPKYV